MYRHFAFYSIYVAYMTIHVSYECDLEGELGNSVKNRVFMGKSPAILNS